jgi:hypothetical protein
MNDLIARRQAAAERQDRARLQWPDYASPLFRQALQPIALELETIAKTIAAAPSAPPVEIARSMMWYGDALFDLAQGRHIPFADAIAAYQNAEPFVAAANDPLVTAKFNANLANILLRGDPRSATLQNVIARYRAALPILVSQRHPSVPTVQRELERAQSLLAQFERLNAELVQRRQEARELLLRISPSNVPLQTAHAMTEKLGRLANLHAISSVSEMLEVLKDAGELVQGLMVLAQSSGGPAAKSRPSDVDEAAMLLWQALCADALTPQAGTRTRDRALGIAGSLVSVVGELRAAAAAARVEILRTRLRDVAAEGRALLARGHATWISPPWPIGKTPPSVNEVHVTETSHRAILEDVLRARGLEIASVPPGREVAEARFEALRRAALVIADIGTGATARAGACYEAGIALVLGKPVLVLAPESEVVPFDIDVEPVLVPARGLTPDMLTAAIDRALILPQRIASPGNIAEMFAAASERFMAQRALLDELRQSLADPILISPVLENILRADAAQSGRSRMVSLPAWPHRYPRRGDRRLFHVTPFRTTWADETKRRVSAACIEVGVTYRRHDDVSDPRIIRSLWDELCLASHVLVDLTELNANVALELGVAETLGKAILMVGQAGTVAALFPTIKRTRVNEYAMQTASLEAAVRRFLSE